MADQYNILLVDDSETTRMIIKRVVQLSGVPTAEIYEAANGRDALEVMSSKKVDLVVADLNMPVMGGIEMMRRMRLSDPTRHVPVVVVSAEPNAENIADLRQAGVAGFLRKPFRPETVRDAVNAALGVAA